MKIVFLLLLSCVVFAFLYWFSQRSKQRVPLKLLPEYSVPVERISKEVLSNGMHVLVFKNSSLPKVLVQIAYDVGSYVENSGERGLAHLIEHMIFKGTDTLSESDIDTIARKYGASFNAFTSMDMTSFYFETDKNNWKPFVPILADCMENARFDEQHLASEIKAVVQEMKLCRDDYWRTMVTKAYELLFPPFHPYHTPVLGFKEDLFSLKAENLKRFYKKYYRPDRATLFIVGDVEPEEAIAQAKKFFEPIKADKDSVTKTFPTMAPELVTYQVRFFEDVKKKQLVFCWYIPGLKSEFEHVASALGIVLGRGRSSRLHQKLVDEGRVAASVSASASKLQEGGIFFVLVEPLAGKSEECARLVKAEVDKLIKYGVTPQELARVAKTKSRKFFQRMQDFTDFTYNWMRWYFAKRDELAIFNRLNLFVKITPEQAQEFAQKYLDPILMSRIDLLPVPEEKKILHEQNKRLAEEIDKKILAKHIRSAPVQEPQAARTYKDPDALDFRFPKPEKIITLPNGLKILLLSTNHSPLVVVNCQFKEALFLNEALEGIPVEMMMDMLMEGSKGYSKRDNVLFFEQHGSSYAFDDRGARFICLKHDIHDLLKRFFYILMWPTFPKSALVRVKELAVENFQRAKDSSKAMGVRIFKNIVYKDHPFSWTFDDAIEMARSVDVARLKELHNNYVSGSNFSMSVVGDFDIEKMSATVEKVFGKLPQGEEKTSPKAPYIDTKQADVDHSMLRDQVILLLGKPSPVTVYDPDFIPLKLLSIMSFRSMGSRIFKLREQTGLFYAAFGGFAANATKHHGFDFVGMLVSPENVVVAEERARKLLAEMTQEGVTSDEIKSARSIYLKDLIDLVSDDASIGHMLCTLNSLELGFDYYDKVLDRVQNMSIDEVNEVLRKYCLPSAMMRVRVGRLGVK